MDFRTRLQWGATFDVGNIPTIHTPVARIFVHHNVIAPTDDPNHDMLVTENADIARFGKPSYDWGIHPSGVVLEGMTVHLSPDTYGHNRDSHSIMYMGNFENDEPTDAAMLAGRELVSLLRYFENVTADVTIEGHRDVYATACPGANLYPRIQELAVPVLATVKDDEMWSIIKGGSQYMLKDGKIVYCAQPLPVSVPVLYHEPNDAEWGVLQRAYGQPVR